MGKDLNGKELGKGFSQRKDKLYSFRWTNKYGRQEVYDISLSALKRNSRKLLAEDEFNLSSSNSGITVNELFDLWIDIYAKQDLKESTRQSYKETYNRYVRMNTIGKSRVAAITPLTVKAQYNIFVEQFSQSVCGTIHSILKNVFDLAVIEEIVYTNKIKSLTIKSKKEKKEVGSLTNENKDIFIKHSRGSFYYNLYLLIINTGMRIGEATALQLDDIDFKKRMIYIRHDLQYHRSKGVFENGKKFKFDTPKNGLTRNIPMNSTVEVILKKQLVMLEDIKSNKLQKHNKKYTPYEGFENLLFISRTGTPIYLSMVSTDIKNIVTKINKLHKDLNMKTFNPHVLRHTFATNCIEQKIDVNALREYLGHANINLTMGTYVDSSQLINDEILKLDRLYKSEVTENNTKLLA